MLQGDAEQLPSAVLKLQSAQWFTINMAPIRISISLMDNSTKRVVSMCDDLHAPSSPCDRPSDAHAATIGGPTLKSRM